MSYITNNETIIHISCNHPTINSEGSDLEEMLLEFLPAQLPDQIIARLSISSAIETINSRIQIPETKIFFDFFQPNGDAFFKKKFMKGEDICFIPAHHQGFCITCNSYGPLMFSDDPEHVQNGYVYFFSRFESDLYAVFRGDSVELDFSIDDSFFNGGTPDCGAICIETHITRNNFIRLSREIRDSIPKDVADLALSNYEEYKRNAHGLIAYQGGFVRRP